jgi:hypothetical protein
LFDFQGLGDWFESFMPSKASKVYGPSVAAAVLLVYGKDILSVATMSGPAEKMLESKIVHPRNFQIPGIFPTTWKMR